ncbi:unnamed protein product [Ambrosiozyma monospora]|uniref:Unnamed protein product n=1 Tax=Ambrosiozyma monospora TaxID=43982 RepID=A0ACB5T9U3_AMBMO|nr:unnamed protein product [Ambrosiozyma monospora]
MLVLFLCFPICSAVRFAQPFATTSTSYSSSILEAVEGNLHKAVANTDDADQYTLYETVTVASAESSADADTLYETVSISSVESSADSVESPSVTPYPNAKAIEWATVMVMESILQQPSLYILKGDNTNLSIVYGRYTNYSSSISYHPGYVFPLNASEKAQLYGFYSDLYSLFDTEEINFVSKLIDLKYSEVDSLTLPVTLPSGLPTKLNVTTDPMLNDYFSMALGSAVYYNMNSICSIHIGS